MVIGTTNGFFFKDFMGDKKKRYSLNCCYLLQIYIHLLKSYQNKFERFDYLVQTDLQLLKDKKSGQNKFQRFDYLIQTDLQLLKDKKSGQNKFQRFDCIVQTHLQLLKYLKTMDTKNIRKEVNKRWPRNLEIWRFTNI